MKNVPVCYTGVTEGKIENVKKEGKMRISILIFIYTIHVAYMKVYTKFHSPKSSLLTSTKNASLIITDFLAVIKENEQRRTASL